jgi:helicase MOV-10
MKNVDLLMIFQVPIAGLINSGENPTQVVLAGDPKQLGPVIRSPVAKQLGLCDSLLHRLMETMDMYQKHDGEYNSACLTKLLRNFRSHPYILKVPSDLFYGNELIPCGDMSITSSACKWEWLPTPGFPMIFHGVDGKDEREPSSPSFFNIAEVAEVVSYVEKIASSKFCGQRLRPFDVGIISPYRGQVNKIHRALERKGLNGYCVGSVEEFQGQERRVIIISTVRSNPAQLLLDQKFRLGFVREPKVNFNVLLR